VQYLFPNAGEGRGIVASECFALLLRVRLQLAMPVTLAWQGRAISGVAMGYDTRRPAWPPALQKQWQEFERQQEGSAERFQSYDTASERLQPDRPHYYLGVLGVDPEWHGTGTGLALVEAFCRQSEADPLSAGTYLETGNPRNIGFYHRCGFAVTGEHDLDQSTRLICLFRPAARHASV
jgi:GNAT superfamily N-acetyltransferase